MKIRDSVALVTGANRGLGLAFAQALLAGGARKVYAAARDPASVTLPGVEAIQLDVTKPEEVEAVARALGDVTLLVNNAGGGAIVNVLSVLSWVSMPTASTYCASKSAAWSLRNELHGQGTQVLALHVGFVDSDMVRDVKAPKSKPEDVAAQTLAALEAGQSEVLADEVSRRIKQNLSADPGVYLVPPAAA